MTPPFAIQVEEVLEQIHKMLIDKNRKYGNSALEPLGVFSQLSAKEGLLIRIDDKLKRIKNGSLQKDDEDVVNDLIGYLVLLKIHENREQNFDELNGSHNWEKMSIPSSGNTFSTTTFSHITGTNDVTNWNPLESAWSYTNNKSHNED
jgi:hypothetical protein